jgi:hypothetical protein
MKNEKRKDIFEKSEITKKLFMKQIFVNIKITVKKKIKTFGAA